MWLLSLPYCLLQRFTINNSINQEWLPVLGSLGWNNTLIILRNLKLKHLNNKNNHDSQTDNINHYWFSNKSNAFVDELLIFFIKVLGDGIARLVTALQKHIICVVTVCLLMFLGLTVPQVFADRNLFRWCFPLACLRRKL